MRTSKVVRVLLGVEHTVVESVETGQAAGGGVVLVVRVRPDRSARSRCSRCGRRARGYDRGDGRRRWRGLDFGTVPVVWEADAPRVSCRAHGVVVAAVPWARARSRFTRDFEDTCAWLAAHAPGSVVAELLRVTWRSVNSIVTRVVAEASGRVDQLAGLRRVGIDEIAFRKGHRYLTTVVDHDTGRLVWAAEGRNSQTLSRFFDALGGRAAALTHVSADGADWIHTVVAEKAPQATLCLDPFHVVAWGTAAVDQVRRGLVADLRAAGRGEQATSLKGTRWALVKNPASLTGDQRTRLAQVAVTNKSLYRGYLLKEQLRAVFETRGHHGRLLLAGWLAWAKRSRLPAFTKLAATIDRYRQLIFNTLDDGGLSNARSEATNTHLRVLTRRSYGFHSPHALIAMAMLTRGGLCPNLPGRTEQLST